VTFLVRQQHCHPVGGSQGVQLLKITKLPISDEPEVDIFSKHEKSIFCTQHLMLEGLPEFLLPNAGYRKFDRP